MTLTAYDDLAVCTLALDELGEVAVEDIVNPTTDIEATCGRIWPLVRDEILSSYDWNCAKGEKQLAASADVTPQSGYTYAYKMPADMLAGSQTVYAQGNFNTPVFDYQIADDHIHCDYSRVDIRYRKTADVSSWPLYLVNFAVIALAARLARPVKEDQALADELRDRAWGAPQLDGNGGLFAKAKRLESQTRPVKSIFANGDPLSFTRF